VLTRRVSENVPSTSPGEGVIERRFVTRILASSRLDRLSHERADEGRSSCP